MSTTSLFRRIFPNLTTSYDRDDEHHGGIGWFPFIRAAGRPINAGTLIPTLYRIARRDERTNISYCYPIGIHLLFKYPRRLWMWSFRFRPSAMERHIEEKVKKKVKEVYMVPEHEPIRKD